MEDFVEDEHVQQKFISVAQGRPGFGQLQQSRNFYRYSFPLLWLIDLQSYGSCS